MNDQPVLNVTFFRTDAERLPVQQWLRSLNKADRKVIGGGEIVLLHGFIKKSQKIPQTDLNVARDRKNLWQSRRTVDE